MRTFKFFSLLIIGLLIITVIPFLFATLQEEILIENYRIESFKVPDSFILDALDGQEASKRLLHEMQKIIRTAKKEPKHRYIDPSQEDSEFMGFPVSPMKQTLKQIFGTEDKIISGEINKRDGKFEVILRVSTAIEPLPLISLTSRDIIQSRILDTLIEQTAIQLLKEIEPFVVGTYYSNTQSFDKLKLFAKKMMNESSDEKKSFGFFAQGYLYDNDKEYNKSIEQYKKAIEVYPNYAEAYYNWGLALYELNDKKGANEKFKKSIEINPKDTEAYNSWGISLDDLGDRKGAIEKYKKTIELDSKYFDAYDNLS